MNRNSIVMSEFNSGKKVADNRTRGCALNRFQLMNAFARHFDVKQQISYIIDEESHSSVSDKLVYPRRV